MDRDFSELKILFTSDDMLTILYSISLTLNTI